MKTKSKKWKSRTIEGFLWFPKMINFKIKWLVHARWKERFMELTSLAPDSPSMKFWTWVGTKWLTPRKTK